MFAPKQYDVLKGVEGISEKQLSEHYKLYEGYINKVNEIREKMLAADSSVANATYSDIGELKRQESFALNGIRLHEAYFGVLGGDGQSSGLVAEAVIRDFGSIEDWQMDMMAAGISSRGWVVLAYDIEEGKLRNYSADTHNLGSVYGAYPVLALDVYEHAYFIDYGTGRKSYIEAFFKNIDWNKVEERYKKIAI